MPVKFKHLEKVVGVFLTIVLLVVVGVIILIGREQRWFEKQYRFTTNFLSGEGLSPGMKVTIKGIQIGEVKSIFLNEDNWIEVTFSVYEEYAERIRKDSVANLKGSLIGGKSLEISLGGRDMPILASGSFIWSDDTQTGAQILEERKKEESPDEITRILNNVERLTYNLSAAEGTLNLALESVQKFFVMLSSEEGNLNQTLASLEEVTSSISEKEGSIGKLMNDDYEVYNNLISILEGLNGIMQDFQQLSNTISDTSPEIKAAIERSNLAMDEAIGLIKMLKSNFFIRGFSSRKADTVIPIENAEREGGYR